MHDRQPYEHRSKQSGHCCASQKLKTTRMRSPQSTGRDPAGQFNLRLRRRLTAFRIAPFVNEVGGWFDQDIVLVERVSARKCFGLRASSRLPK